GCGLWLGGTGVSGCRVPIVATPVQAPELLHDDIPVAGSPSSQTSPTFFLASAGHAAPLPPHVSAMSHGSAAGRHSWPAGRNAHAAVQQAPGGPLGAAPRSHCSPGSMAPLPPPPRGGAVVV